MILLPPRSTPGRSSAASDVYKRQALVIIAASLLTFFVVGRLENIDFNRPSDRYSLQDLSSATVVAIAFIYLMHNTRLASWLKSRKIEQQSEEMRSDKEKIDNLLLNILPPVVAEELKGQGYVKPVFYPAATLVFTDFVGFTKISEALTPDQLVRELDSAFSRFDRVMDKYGLEKLKTIGDSYMYAGGVPLPNATHAIDAVLGALEIQSFVEQINLEKSQSGRPVFEIRIGINSGPLMAGVVGEKKFVYDVWGDSVNPVSYTHLRAHETVLCLVCRLLLEQQHLFFLSFLLNLFILKFPYASSGFQQFKHVHSSLTIDLPL